MSQDVAAVIRDYPAVIQKKLLFLRELIYRTASELVEPVELEETLKWGEPSYVTKPKTGSTIRIDWKRKFPAQYAMYFHCKTTLVDTFKEIHGDKFRYEGNRAILFYLDDEIPVAELKDCIALALTYHRRR